VSEDTLIQLAQVLATPLSVIVTALLAILLHFSSRYDSLQKERRERRAAKVDQTLEALTKENGALREAIAALANICIQWQGKTQVVGDQAEQLGVAMRQITCSRLAIEVIEHQLQIADCPEAAQHARQYSDTVEKTWKGFLEFLQVPRGKEESRRLYKELDAARDGLFASIVQAYRTI
jgi:hypothetical protein